MKLRSYQKQVIDKLGEIYKTSQYKTFKLQAPTGSGKTLITAKMIEKIINTKIIGNSNDVTFVYLSPSNGKLDYQSYEKINKYKVDGVAKGYNCNSIRAVGKGVNSADSLSFSEFKNKNVYFIGWSLLKKNANTLKIGDRRNLYQIVQNTKDNKTKIVLIIDEAHREFTAKKRTKSTSTEREEFLDFLNPDFIIEMSATLDIKDDSLDFIFNRSVNQFGGKFKTTIFL